MSRLTNAQIKEALTPDPNFATKSWGNIVLEDEEKEAAAYAAMSPANKARRNEHKKRMAAFNIPAPVAATRRNNGAARGRPPRHNATRANRGPAGFGATRNNRGPRRNNRGAAGFGARGAPAATRRNNAGRPRPGKFMRECRNNPTGCARHRNTHNCKFVHSDEPEFGMLRANQRL